MSEGCGCMDKWICVRLVCTGVCVCVDECQVGVYSLVWMSVRWVCTGGIGVWISG